MKAFISHASADKRIAIAIHKRLEPGTAWLDRAEIEWGDRFIQRIEDGLEQMSDFVLLWSVAASKSAWVEHELDMAFVRHLDDNAVRIRVVRIDATPLPLRLEPFHHLSVEDAVDPAEVIADALREAFAEPSKGTRHGFLNRNSELDRIETTINDSDTRIVALRGFLGAGKASLAREALRRFFEGPSIVDIDVNPGVGPVELALRLHHEAHREIIPDTATGDPLGIVEAAMRVITNRGQFMLFANVQHWLDDEGEPEEPLSTIIRAASTLPDTVRKPLILTSTRFIGHSAEFASTISGVAVHGLADAHVATLVTLWHELSEGSQLEPEDAARLAPHLHGHPVAAKLAATLVSRYGVDHLLDYPRELKSLRRDLAKTLIRDIDVTGGLLSLMEMLAIIGSPVPSRVLAKALGLASDEFHAAVSDATATGLANVGRAGWLATHPLVSDYFWRSHHDREGYMQRAKAAAESVHEYLDELPVESETKIDVLRAVVRLYAIAGLDSKARAIRRDLTGELTQVAYTHYHRRQYDLAERFIGIVLEDNPKHWGLRKCLARIHVHRHRWAEADETIAELLSERPRDLPVQHLRGWRQLRDGDREGALVTFTRVLARKHDRVATLRDAAECLYRLERSEEALEFIERAKAIESDNAYVLDLEARIYEHAGEYEKALSAMQLAVLRNHGSWNLHHRMARILHALGERRAAMEKAADAVRLDSAQFVPLHTLVSYLLDEGLAQDAADKLPNLRQLAANAQQRELVNHLEARERHLATDYDAALGIVNRQIRRGTNLAASLGLLARIKLDQIEGMSAQSPALARMLLEQAEEATRSCIDQPDHDPGAVDNLRKRIEATRVVLDGLPAIRH